MHAWLALLASAVCVFLVASSLPVCGLCCCWVVSSLLAVPALLAPALCVFLSVLACWCGLLGCDVLFLLCLLGLCCLLLLLVPSCFLLACCACCLFLITACIPSNFLWAVISSDPVYMAALMLSAFEASPWNHGHAAQRILV